jgi:outer membrane protein OmpA-like peptidoglycan-associated protein
MKLILGSFVGVAITLSGTAWAQETKSADDYVCQFAPESCGDEEVSAEVLTKEKPPTKGFSLTRGKAPAQQASQQTAPARMPAAAAPMAAKRLAPKRQERPTQTASIARPLSRNKASAASGAQGEGDLNLSFELGSANLTSQGKANARAFAAALKRPELESKKVLIGGHTDRSGDYDRNVELSKLRAEAVKDYLISQGISPMRLEAKGFGPDKPIPAGLRAMRKPPLRPASTRTHQRPLRLPYRRITGIPADDAPATA